MHNVNKHFSQKIWLARFHTWWALRNLRDVIFLRVHYPFQYTTSCLEDGCIFLTSLIRCFQACKNFCNHFKHLKMILRPTSFYMEHYYFHLYTQKYKLPCSLSDWYSKLLVIQVLISIDNIYITGYDKYLHLDGIIWLISLKFIFSQAYWLECFLIKQA